MTDQLSHRPPTAAGQPLPASGRHLRRLLHGRPPAVRALIAAKLVSGEWQYVRPTPSQAARLVSVNVGRVSVALGNVGKRGPRDRTIDRVIVRYGAEALLRGLDRYTSPRLPL